MKKSGVLLKALVFSGLMVINGQSAVLCESRPSSEICISLLLYQYGMEKSFAAASIECIPGTWTGTTDSYWNTATNWCDEKVPNSTTNVTIPSGGNQPVINSAAMCNNLTIQSGASLIISHSNSLTVSGDLVNNGFFTMNQSTVIFNGDNQKIGKGPYNNLTFRGNGIKTIAITGEAFYYGLLSMEELASVFEIPYPATTSSLQYDTPYARTTGPEWPSLYTAGGITIKNTGIISLNSSKGLTNSSGNRCNLTVEKDATLDMDKYNIQKPEIVNLKCGGLTKGSSIIGTGTLYLEDTQVYVSDAGDGTAGAMITCKVNLGLSNTFNIANDEPNIFTDDDLTISIFSTGSSLTKSGSGTLNLGASELSLQNLNIDQGNVIIPVGAQISVSNETTIMPAKGLTIKSSASGTGSLIANIVSGTVIVERFMTPGGWHIVSSPVSDQTVGEFLIANGNIPNNTVSGHTSERGMRGYDPSANQWGDFYTNASTDDMTKGKGFLVRVKGATGTKNVTFSGILNTGEVPVSGLAAGKWNCIGNPYASAIRINSEFDALKFLGVNSENLDPLYGAIYIWDQLDASNGMADKYTIISNASIPYEIQLGQAFMVKMAIGKTSVNFKKIMQVHNSNLALKSTTNIWPTIHLKVISDSITSSTIIAFHEGMTAGLDPTYDAGLLKAGDEMSLYTLLVEDQGIPFAIQALPADYKTIVVPLGIDGAKGGSVCFSAELLHIPLACKAILEDRLNNMFTDLSVSSYTADLKGSTSSQGRFFLHTSYSTTEIDSRDRIQNLSAWSVSNHVMKISGEVGIKATAILYDIQGRLVLSEPLKAGLYHTIRLPEIKPGIYILQVGDTEHKQVLKIFVSE